MKRKHLTWVIILAFGILTSCNQFNQNQMAYPTTTHPANYETITPTNKIHSPTASPQSTQTIPASSENNTPLPQPTSTQTETPPLIFAVIGDYGLAGKPEEDVANLVKSWHPSLILTTGDNNYRTGSMETIDENIGQYYHEFIYNYQGAYGNGADILRFFPSLGNHDWDSKKGQPYFDYFTLPGNERYYDFSWGPVHFFALDSDSREPDGVGLSSIQAEWLKEKLSEATEPWKIVYMHHPPYSSATHGSTDWMQWHFKDWGASVVLSGHDHVYERIIRDGFPYITIGASGNPNLYEFPHIVEGSAVRYRQDYGAIRTEATSDSLILEFITRNNELIDRFEVSP